MIKTCAQKQSFQDFKDFLKPPKEGDIIKGIVVNVGTPGIFLDLENYKTGLLKKEDLKICGKSISKMEKGEELHVKIVGGENKAGFVPVSLREAREEMTWEELIKYKEDGTSVEAKVASANKGGLLFNVSGVQGFLPVSQLSKKNYPKMENPTPEKIFQELKNFVGMEMEVKVITVDKNREKLILKEA
jgi:small subunit ribosomal protein S1